ncbi:MAG: CoA-binding protein [Promethearchaeota archaeon]
MTKIKEKTPSSPELSQEHFLYDILNPKSICVFGANNNLLNTMGSMQLRNIIAGGFPKDEIYPIHPNLDKVQGIKTFKSVLDLPKTPDLAFIILKPNIIPQILDECGQKGIKSAIITSGGFRESGPDGVELSKKIDNIAKKYDMRFIGPNCLGIYNGYFQYPERENAYINTFWIYVPHKRGNISLVSQSGTIAAQTAWHTNYMGVKIGKSISVGNERNIDIVDFLEFFKIDPHTEVIGLYIEEIKRGKEFIKIAKDITPKKPIVAIYAGGTEAADRAIKSHTGSIGGNNKIYDAVFKKTGIISTDSITDFLYYLRTLSYAQINKIFPKGRRVGIITDSGGSGSILTKSTELLGLEVPKFSKSLQHKIAEFLPPTGSKSNPVDITFFKSYYNFFVKIPRLIIQSGEVDSIIFDGIFDFLEVFDIIESSGFPVDEKLKSSMDFFFSAIIKPIQNLARKKSIPFFYSGPQLYNYPLYQSFISNDINIFSLWDQPTKSMKILCDYSEYRRKFS